MDIALDGSYLGYVAVFLEFVYCIRHSANKEIYPELLQQVVVHGVVE